MPGWSCATSFGLAGILSGSSRWPVVPLVVVLCDGSNRSDWMLRFFPGCVSARCRFVDTSVGQGLFVGFVVFVLRLVGVLCRARVSRCVWLPSVVGRGVVAGRGWGFWLVCVGSRVWGGAGFVARGFRRSGRRWR